jgi:hypothetical protein
VHLSAALALGEDKLFGHIKPRKLGPGSWSLLLPMVPLPGRQSDRDHLRQLLRDRTTEAVITLVAALPALRFRQRIVA